MKRGQQTRFPIIFALAPAFVFLISTEARVFAADAPPGKPAKSAFDAPLGEPLDPNVEQEAFKQYDASAAQLQNEAIQKLWAAVNEARVAIIDDDLKDYHQKQAVAAVRDALEKFEEAARDEKKAAYIAAELKQMGIAPPEPTYDPEAVAKALESMRGGSLFVAQNSRPESKELYLKAADLEKRSADELGEAVKAAQAAGMKDPTDAEGRAAKEDEALDHAKRALGGFEMAQGTAILANGMRWNPDSGEFYDPYGRNNREYRNKPYLPGPNRNPYNQSTDPPLGSKRGR